MARIGPIAIVPDEKSFARADARLAKYQGRYLEARARRVYLEAAKLGVPAIKAWAPVKSGHLQRKVRAQIVRTRAGEMAAATVGPRSPHRHLVIRGHRIVTHDGRDTGRRSRPNPFVDEAFSAYGEAAQRYIAERVVAMDVGGLSTSVTTSFSPF